MYYREVQDRPEEAVRLVGFFEYRNVLERYQQLLRSATQKELKLMDELVQRDPQYSIYVHLLRFLPQAKLSAFASPSDRGDVRKGLAWVIALARLEHGAIVAAYTNEKTPLPGPRQGASESRAFDELLLEAALMHVWALQNDPLVTGRRNGVAIRTRPTKQQLLAYERRISLTWKLLKAVHVRQAAGMSQVQRAEFSSLCQQTDLLRKQLRKNLLGLGGGIR